MVRRQIYSAGAWDRKFYPRRTVRYWFAVTNDHVWVTVDATPYNRPLPTTPNGKVGL